MKHAPALPPPPPATLTVLVDRSPPAEGFLRMVRRELSVARPGQGPSAPFVYDEVDRRALDAVVVAAHFTRGGERCVVLRSAVRPPVALRDAARSPIPEPAERALWELPAGLVEPSEASEQGLALAAARELHEETGLSLPPERLAPLGPSTFPCPGVLAERHFYFHVEVEPEQRQEPPLDGSPLEQVGELVAVPLRALLAAARRGELADAKTELGLRRLAELFDPPEAP
jgi:ADP-ribose pyrophosphatase